MKTPTDTTSDTTPKAAPDTAYGLSGKLLIAMPGLNDERFDNSVVYMCSHAPDGSMGIILNKPIEDVTLGNILDQLKIDTDPILGANIVYYGGPIETGQGFILHSADYDNNASTLDVDEHISMTATRDILEDIARNKGPAQSILALGYAGWSPGQLEQELQQNVWLTCDASETLIFNTSSEKLWSRALAELGINPLMLSATGGSA